MAYNDNVGCGLLGQLFGLVMLVIIGFCLNWYNDSERGMIKEARGHQYVYKYAQYLNKYPSGKYVPEAYDSIFSLLTRQGNVMAMIDYAHKYSEMPLSKELSRIAYDSGVEKREISYWEYYIKYIDNEYKLEAERQLFLLQKEKEQQELKEWGTEALAWHSVQKQKSYEAYCKYMKLYPQGKHAKAANKAVIDMEVAKDFSGLHGQMPDLHRTGYNTSKYSSVYVKNQTQYALTVLYSGTHSDKLEVSPHSSGLIRLPNDNYRISAKVKTERVIPYVGTASLSGGEYTSSYYISTTRY